MGDGAFCRIFFVPAVHQPQQYKHRNGPTIRCKAARRAGRIAAQRGKAHRDRRGQDLATTQGRTPSSTACTPAYRSTLRSTAATSRMMTKDGSTTPSVATSAPGSPPATNR